MKAEPSAPQSLRARLVGLVLAGVIPGCVTMAWQRPDTDAAVASKDLQECQRLGQVQASRMSLASPIPSTPALISSPAGAVMQAPPLPFSTPDPTLAQQFTIDCMHKKGYGLVRVK
jgi:hypothetical protein